jgi:hypothetical protein
MNKSTCSWRESQSKKKKVEFMVLVDLDESPFGGNTLDIGEANGKRRARQGMPTEIIFVQTNDDDALLDELLDENYGSPPVYQRSKALEENYGVQHDLVSEMASSKDTSTTESSKQYEKQKKAPSDTTSTTRTEELSDEDRVGEKDFLTFDHYKNEDFDETLSVSSMESEESAETTTLLARAHDRIALQHLQEEVVSLQAAVQKKNEEIEHLSSQLRRAVATKCDLVIAHTELERHHDFNLQLRDKDVKELKLSNCSLKEKQAEIEKQLLDELVKMTDELQEAKKAHQAELDDWERMHRNEMLEKDFSIAQLVEEVRALQYGDVDGIWSTINEPNHTTTIKSKKKSGRRVLLRAN